jgi:AcrR family transcriptional regulator
MNPELNEKQIKILQVAEKLFAEKGFDGTSIRDIAREAKINVAMVSYYFGSKEKMLESLIFSRTSDMKLQLESLSKEVISPVEKINKLIALYITQINRNKCIYQILHFELTSKKRELDLKSFTEVKKQNFEIIKKIIEEGQEKGVFRKEVNIFLIPSSILGPFFHFQMNRPHYEEMLGLNTNEAYDNYIKNELTQHIQQTIQSLLLYEK